MIGMGVIQFVRLGGAGKIIAVEPVKTKAPIAQEMGADVVLDPESEGEGLREKVYPLTGGIGADIVFECAGVPATFQQSFSLCKSGGQVIGVGINEKEFSFNPLEFILKEIEMKGAVGYYEEFDYVIDFLDRGVINPKPFISDVIALDDIIEKGFERMLGASYAIKILVKP
jgi:(R,R)-butanediol dehydrogenase/meso-butanediol dehydrogenase/diacetyl reductase